ITSAPPACSAHTPRAAGPRALATAPSLRTPGRADPAFTPAVHEPPLDRLYGSCSAPDVLPFPDPYGGRERINLPGTVGPPNWGYRVPWTVEDLCGSAGAALQGRLRALAARHGRAPG